jgi:hypothetical protein
LSCDRSFRWKKDSVFGEPRRPDIAFFSESSTAVTDNIILTTNAIFPDNKRHYPEEHTPSS